MHQCCLLVVLVVVVVVGFVFVFDEVDEEGAIGRSTADAPDIDGVVYLNDEFSLAPGDIVEVEITHSDEYDLWGELT